MGGLTAAFGARGLRGTARGDDAGAAWRAATATCAPCADAAPAVSDAGAAEADGVAVTTDPSAMTAPRLTVMRRRDMTSPG